MSSPMSEERTKKLRKLVSLMNTRHKNPFPVNEHLLKCFDVAVTPEETDFLIRLGTEPFTLEKGAGLSQLPEPEFRVLLQQMMKKGFIWPQDTEDGSEQFALSGIMLGWFEIYLSDGEETPEKREFARNLDDMFKSFWSMNVLPVRDFFNSRVRESTVHQSIVPPGKKETIKVGKTVDTGSMRVYPGKTVEELIEKYGDSNSIAVIHCFCRQYHKMIDEPCRFKHPPESCLAIGSFSKYASKYGNAKTISKSEALNLIRELQSKGAIHQVFHKDEDINNPEIAICNCCWDCCGVFGSYSRGILPLKLHSYFEAEQPVQELCNGCGTCAEYCPTHAITVEDKCRVESSLCIGCGQCEIQCPQGAIELLAKERDVFLPLKPRSEARIK